MSVGRLFQTCGATTTKAQRPTVVSLKQEITIFQQLILITSCEKNGSTSLQSQPSTYSSIVFDMCHHVHPHLAYSSMGQCKYVWAGDCKTTHPQCVVILGTNGVPVSADRRCRIYILSVFIFRFKFKFCMLSFTFSILCVVSGLV